jgi:SAM-dependent methyltransferase
VRATGEGGVTDALAAQAARYYAAKLQEYGPTPRGVDWNDERTQRIRFDHLLEVLSAATEPFSLIDFGCGYGALLDSLVEHHEAFTYTGYDVAPEMVAEARRRYPAEVRARFTSDRDGLEPADYAVASGVFNVKQDTAESGWHAYVYEIVDTLARLSSRGFAFNALTAHADPERRRPDLFYADPAAMIDHCLRTYSRDLVLRHDYELYEFTVIVYLDRRPPVARSG